MGNIIPDISYVIICGQSQCSLKTIKSHIILLGIETAQTQVVKQLCIVDTHL